MSLKEGPESNGGLSMTPSRLRALRRLNVKLGLSQSAMMRLDGLGVKEVITSRAVQRRVHTCLFVSQHCFRVLVLIGKMGMN